MSGRSMSVELPAEVVEEVVGAVAALVMERLDDTGSPDSTSPWMTVDQLSAYLGWPKARIYKLTSAEAIPCRKHEGRLLFHRIEVDRWLDAYREGPRV